MFGFGKKKVEPEQSQNTLGNPDKSWIYIEIEKDNSLKEPKDNDEAVDIGGLYAGFLYVLSSKDILPGIMKAVIIQGEQTPRGKVVASTIATLINKAIGMEEKRVHGRPIIRPTEVFMRKTKEEDQ
jgi:hypothetical protein